MSKRKIKYHIIGNWKMNKTMEDALNFVEQLIVDIKSQTQVSVVVCAPYTVLGGISRPIEDSNCNLSLGAQNMHPEPSGAFTGEISAVMLRNFYVKYVILGHSERRNLLGEDDAFINRKVLAALESTMQPILCVGETLEQREAGQTMDVVKEQLEKGLAGVNKTQADELLVAYEPVWAIGTGKTAIPEMVQEVHANIRDILTDLDLFSKTTATNPPILYGGSMTPANAEGLLSESDVNGGLIGGAALERHTFLKLINIAQKLSNPTLVHSS